MRHGRLDEACEIRKATVVSAVTLPPASSFMASKQPSGPPSVALDYLPESDWAAAKLPRRLQTWGKRITKTRICC